MSSGWPEGAFNLPPNKKRADANRPEGNHQDMNTLTVTTTKSSPVARVLDATEQAARGKDGLYAIYYRFKDDRRKPDDEKLTLEIETRPHWSPGADMSGRDLDRRG